MTNSDVVRVAVEIVDNFSDELTTLESRLEKIDGKNLDVDLDIDDGDIETVKGKLEALEKELNATLDIDVSGYTRAKAKKEYLERDMHSTLHLGVEQDRLPNLGNLNGGNGFNPPKTPEGPEINTSSISDVNFPAIDDNKLTNKGNLSPDEKEVVNDFLINPSVAKLHNKGIPKEDRDGWIGPSNWAFGIDEQFGPSNTNDRTPAETNFLSNIKKATESSTSLEIGDDLFSNSKFGDLEIQAKGFDSNLFAPKSLRSLSDYQFGIDYTVGKDMPRISSSFVKNDDDGLLERIGKSRLNSMRSVNLPSIGIFGSDDDDGLNEKIKSLIPTMQKWYRLVALVIPLLITMAGAALGAAAALGSLAGVGAAMVGIGLLGYGDSLSESLRNAQKRTQQLKEELFDVFQPVAGVFQPFVEQLFGKIPKVAGQLTEPLKDLEASGFDNFFIGALEGTGDFLADLIRLINQLAPEIQAIGAGLGRVFGDILLGLLQWSVKELYNNWDAFSRLGLIIIDLLVILYNLAKVVSFALSFFKPLFDILVGISNVFENRLSASILAGVAAMIALYYAASSVAAAFAIIKGSAIAQALYSGVIAAGSLTGALASVSMTLSTIIAQMTALNMLTGGVLLAAGAVVGYLAYQELKPETPSLPTGGTSSPSGFGSPSPTGGYGSGTQINIYGDVGRDEYQRLRDEFPDMYQEQSKIDEETER